MRRGGHVGGLVARCAPVVPLRRQADLGRGTCPLPPRSGTAPARRGWRGLRPGRRQRQWRALARRGRSNAGAQVRVSAMPVLPGVWDLLENGGSLEEVTESGCTFLHFAAEVLSLCSSSSTILTQRKQTEIKSTLHGAPTHSALSSPSSCGRCRRWRRSRRRRLGTCATSSRVGRSRRCWCAPRGCSRQPYPEP